MKKAFLMVLAVTSGPAFALEICRDNTVVSSALTNETGKCQDHLGTLFSSSPA